MGSKSQQGGRACVDKQPARFSGPNQLSALMCPLAVITPCTSETADGYSCYTKTAFTGDASRTYNKVRQPKF